MTLLPENLRGKRHTDYPWGLRWIPREWTAFDWGVPRLVYGGTNSWAPTGSIPMQAPKPINPPGGWQLSRFEDGPWFAWYFAFTTKKGIHYRIGARWDDVDNYVEFPTIARKVLS